MNQLEQLKTFSTLVADTGDLHAIKTFLPQDTTTNPSLILKTIQNQKDFLKKTINQLKAKKINDEHEMVNHLMVEVGSNILAIISGRVSIEVPAHLSFNQQKTMEEARKIIALFAEKGITKKQVLIKIAGTYEGISAARELEKNEIHCNLTLVFSLNQAIHAADAGITLISPFVGRVLDWYQQKNQKTYAIAEDPGVALVKNIFHTLKGQKYSTEIMAASFRKKEQVLALAGCDLLTISPTLLEALKENNERVDEALNSSKITNLKNELNPLTENNFRWQLCLDEMANHKLNEGIRLFHRDYEKLLLLIKEQL